MVVASMSIALLAAAYAAYRITAQETKTTFQVGDSMSAFRVLDITGPNKGKDVCYV